MSKVMYTIKIKVIGEEQETNRFFEHVKQFFHDESLDRKSNIITYNALLHIQAPKIEVFDEILESSKMFPKLNYICISSDVHSYTFWRFQNGKCEHFQTFSLESENMSHEFDVDEFESKTFDYLFDEVFPKISSIGEFCKHRDLYQTELEKEQTSL
ncbi:hypothetical protein [Dysgonomonas sp. 520]|uniref:hypothetical protein n=1 Tax=Dysgonomonas sp. 520 TaxID=2302931 RepID=UPI0013D222DB|nr:hypothetical protein [Dysgonomonas sp. 520]NDW10421.1 hypothetical protein [Dysgonomonas sp. 520]